jgi:acyl-CoA synthetase (AMP-forming)/AMP-acid ligase II
MRGETPVAFVEAEQGKTPDPEALRAWCRERLAGYKVPRRVVVVEELPRNPTGKILRRALSERVKAEQKQGAGA